MGKVLQNLIFKFGETKIFYILKNYFKNIIFVIIQRYFRKLPKLNKNKKASSFRWTAVLLTPINTLLGIGVYAASKLACAAGVAEWNRQRRIAVRIFFDQVLDLECEGSRHRGAPVADHVAFQIIGHVPGRACRTYATGKDCFPS